MEMDKSGTKRLDMVAIICMDSRHADAKFLDTVSPAKVRIRQEPRSPELPKRSGFSLFF